MSILNKIKKRIFKPDTIEIPEMEQIVEIPEMEQIEDTGSNPVPSTISSESRQKQTPETVLQDVTSQVRGHVRYVAYSKKAKVKYADGVIKRLFGMYPDPQKTMNVLMRHRRSKRTKDLVSIPKSAVIPLNNPNRYVVLSHTSKGVPVEMKHSVYAVLINYILEQDKKIEAKNTELRNKINEINRLSKTSQGLFDQNIENVKKTVESITPVIKGLRPRKAGEPLEDQYVRQ